jgi:hypothetical protein
MQQSQHGPPRDKSGRWKDLSSRVPPEPDPLIRFRVTSLAQPTRHARDDPKLTASRHRGGPMGPANYQIVTLSSLCPRGWSGELDQFVTENVVVPVYARGGPGLDMSASAAGGVPAYAGPGVQPGKHLSGVGPPPAHAGVCPTAVRRAGPRRPVLRPSIPRAARERGLEYATVGGLASSSAAQVKDLQPRRTRRLYRVITRSIIRSISVSSATIPGHVQRSGVAARPGADTVGLHRGQAGPWSPGRRHAPQNTEIANSRPLSTRSATYQVS